LSSRKLVVVIAGDARALIMLTGYLATYVRRCGGAGLVLPLPSGQVVSKKSREKAMTKPLPRTVLDTVHADGNMER
jgi:hypothetical protein